MPPSPNYHANTESTKLNQKFSVMIHSYGTSCYSKLTPITDLILIHTTFSKVPLL